ncbi:fibrinogen-like protein 1 [Drosophila takahashii]|uniref:fibrinogen-like protein 1 n=1 Tax=Drosophila takahashii TaxID=29030 RepID=UPI003898FA38
MDDAELSNKRKEKVLSLEATVKDLQNQLVSTKKQLSVKEIQVKDKDRQIENLRDTSKLMSEIKEQLKTQRDANVPNLEATVKVLQIQLDRTTKQLDDKEIQIKDKDRQIKDLTNKSKLISDLEATVKVLQSQLESTAKQLSDQEIQMKAKDKEMEKLRNTSKLMNEITEQPKTHRDENLPDLEATLKDLQNQLDRTAKELSDQEIQMKDKDRQIEELRNTTKLMNKISDQFKTQRDENLPDYCPSGRPNGIYQIKLPGIDPFEVPCESSTPGWTVIQRRLDGSENFKRGWQEYKDGFGDVHREFFIGLERLHLMTAAQPFELHIQLRDVKGITRYAHYDDFRVAGEKDSYKLDSVGKYFGTTGDSLSQLKGNNFTTFDRDNRCEDTHSGGWWEDTSCSVSMLNGKYYKDGLMEEDQEYGIYWGSFRARPYSLTFVQMMIKPKA